MRSSTTRRTEAYRSVAPAPNSDGSGRTRTTEYGTIVFSGNGSALNSPEFDVAGGALTLDNQINNLANRINDSAVVKLYGGSVLLKAGSSAPVYERIGTLELAADDCGVVTNYYSGNSAPSTLVLGQLVRQPHAVGYTDGGTLAQGRVLLENVPPLIGGGAGAGPTSLGIIPWMRSGFMTYDAGADANDPADDVGLRSLRAEEYEPAISIAPSSGPAPNVQLAAGQTLGAPASVNSLSVANQVLTLQNGAMLTINSGALNFDGGRISGDGALATTGEMIITGGGTLSVPISAQSLTLSGSYTLTAPNNLPGGIVVDGINLTTPAALGTGPLRIRGAGWRDTAETRGKTAIGNVWETRSSGRCVFLLVGKDDMEDQLKGVS